MKIGMIGLPQVGKKTLYELLAGHKPTENEIASGRPIKGVAQIKDARFDRLVTIYRPKKEVRARIELELLPKIEKDTIAKGDIFKDINELDAICHVVRVFKDDAVYHVDGSVDPKRDIDFINAELLLHDMIFVEKRMERLDKTVKQTKDDSAIKERDVLARLKAHLDQSKPLRTFEFSPDDRKLLASYPLITRKDMFIVLNVAEDGLGDMSLKERLRSELAALKIDVMQVSAKVEEEIMALESEAERKEFMQSLAIEEPAVNVFGRLCISVLNLISFFTVGADEVRQWNVRRGSTAPEAAGAIHTDLQKGFIRAEMMKYEDIASMGGEDKVKAAGKAYLKGKEYVVEDGDVLNIRFNV
jgi:GTP-binding protein YchF